MQNDDALVERIAMTICRGGGTGLCVGFCHSKRCPDAIAQYGVTARAILPQVTGTQDAYAAGFAAGAAEMRERAETAVHNALIAFASAEANATPDAMYSAAVSAIAALPKEPKP